MENINYLLKKDLREKIKGINILIIIPIMIYLFIISEGFNLLLKAILPRYCYAMNFYREGACPDIFKFIQDFSFIFALLGIGVINFLLYLFFRYKKINIKEGLLFVNNFIIISILSYFIFSLIRLNVLNTSCNMTIGGLGMDGFYCGKNYYLLNFYPGRIFLLIWFVLFILYVSIFFKKSLPGIKNIFISKKIIICYLITMIISIILMILFTIGATLYNGYLSFKEVVKSGITIFIFLNYFLAVMYVYLLKGKNDKYIYILSFLICLFEILVINIVLNSNNFYLRF